MGDCSPGDYLLLLHDLLLLLRESAEELYLVLVRRPPLVVCFESAAQVSLDLHVEGLRLDHGVGGVVHSWDGFGGAQVMQVACEFCELLPSSGLLSLLFLKRQMLLVIV